MCSDDGNVMFQFYWKGFKIIFWLTC
jgi:hypothetical protein